MNVSVIPEQECPYCGYLQNRSTGCGHDQPPKPGDVTVCWHCGEFFVFDENLLMRPPTDAEIVAIEKEIGSDLDRARKLCMSRKR